MKRSCCCWMMIVTSRESREGAAGCRSCAITGAYNNRQARIIKICFVEFIIFLPMVIDVNHGGWPWLEFGPSRARMGARCMPIAPASPFANKRRVVAKVIVSANALRTADGTSCGYGRFKQRAFVTTYVGRGACMENEIRRKAFASLSRQDGHAGPWRRPQIW